MRISLSILMLASTFSALPAWAEDYPAARTEAKASEVGGMLKKEKLAFRPQAGVMVYTNDLNQQTSRLAAGLTIDWNLASTFVPEGSNAYLGLSSGIIYSHLGNDQANFFGSNSSVGGNEGANFFYVPADLKLGYNFTDNFRLAAHGGANITYRSIPSAMILGTDNSSNTKAYPNVGADMEWGVGGIAVGLRPDVTLGTEKAIFTGSLTFAVPLA